MQSQAGSGHVSVLCVYCMCVGQWLAGGLGALAFDLELRGQAADGQPAGHFHLKDPRGPLSSIFAHTHAHSSKFPSLLSLVSHFLLLRMVGWFMSVEELQPFISL